MGKQIIKAKFTYFTNESNWVGGKCGDLLFQAKLFDQPSNFGINKGRVSKLTIHNQKKIILNYDRGWDIKPSLNIKPDFDAIMDLLENSPKRFDIN